MTLLHQSIGPAPGAGQGRALPKITAIAAASTLLDFNSILRDLCSQHRRKSLGSKEFINAYSQLTDRAIECDMRFFSAFNTFAPVFVTPDFLFSMQSDMADLMEKEELQQAADLLRSGKLDLAEHHWQLKWHFLLERGVDLGYFWDSEAKRFK